MGEQNTARLALTVRDERGEPSPFKAEWRGPDGPIRRLWSDTGTGTIEAPAGRLSVLVRRGIHYDAVALELDLPAGRTTAHEVTLRQRFSPRDMGWYGGESHMHVLHGRNDPPRTIADGGRMAAADGLDYLQCAAAWDADFNWLSTEELNRQCRAASSPHTVVGWNIETPKAYMSEDHGGKKGNLHCFGHGWTVALKDNSKGRDFFSTGPNFRVLQEVHRQGGIVGCAHPVRFWLMYGNYVSNWNAELPFDFVAGVPYDAVDILNDSPLLFAMSERYWHNLLNMGYKVAGTGNSDGALGSTPCVGRYRTYTRIEGEFTWQKLAEAMRAGRNVATSGPFVLFEVDGRGPGAEFPADGRGRKATVRAWSGALPGETITSVQLVRNGEAVRAWDLREEELREWQTEFELRDSEFAWYCVRVLSQSRDPQSVWHWGEQTYELAVANPVYFLPEGFERPRPIPARLSLKVTDEAGRPLAADVTVLDDDAVVARHRLPASGEAALTMPATASLSVGAPGCRTVERSLYMDCPEIFEYCRNLNQVWPSYFTPEAYRNLHAILGNLKLSVTLPRA